MFDSIATLAVAQNMRELYRLVLVDTPLAPYFSGPPLVRAPAGLLAAVVGWTGGFEDGPGIVGGRQ